MSQALMDLDICHEYQMKESIRNKRNGDELSENT